MRILAFCYELSKKVDIQLFMCPEVEKTSSGCLSFSLTPMLPTGNLGVGENLGLLGMLNTHGLE